MTACIEWTIWPTVVAMSDTFSPLSGFPLIHFPVFIITAFRPSTAFCFFLLYRLHMQQATELHGMFDSDVDHDSLLEIWGWLKESTMQLKKKYNKTQEIINFTLNKTLMPPPSTASQNYGLRLHLHDRQLPGHASHVMDCEFITRTHVSCTMIPTNRYCRLLLIFSACLFNILLTMSGPAGKLSAALPSGHIGRMGTEKRREKIWGQQTREEIKKMEGEWNVPVGWTSG